MNLHAQKNGNPLYWITAKRIGNKWFGTICPRSDRKQPRPRLLLPSHRYENTQINSSQIYQITQICGNPICQRTSRSANGSQKTEPLR